MKPFERNLLDCFIDDLENPGVETVHLGVALETHHAVTDVPNACGAIPVNSFGAAFDISERRIYYYAHERSASVTITNSGDEEREYVINTHGWDDRTKELAPKLIAYPPVFQLQPGDQQKVRLLLRNRSGFEAPLFFRFVIGGKK